MVYMLVIVLADSSEANELVPQITSKNPLESWRERQEDFFFLLLCIHLAVQEHIQWCYWVTGGRNIVQEGAWTLRAGRFQHWGWGSESKQYGPLARKCTAQVGQVFPSVCTALSMRCHGDCQRWIRGPWWKNWWKWRPESCCVEELPQKNWTVSLLLGMIAVSTLHRASRCCFSACSPRLETSFTSRSVLLFS